MDKNTSQVNGFSSYKRLFSVVMRFDYNLFCILVNNVVNNNTLFANIYCQPFKLVFRYEIM